MKGTTDLYIESRWPDDHIVSWLSSDFRDQSGCIYQCLAIEWCKMILNSTAFNYIYISEQTFDLTNLSKNDKIST